MKIRNISNNTRKIKICTQKKWKWITLNAKEVISADRVGNLNEFFEIIKHRTAEKKKRIKFRRKK